MTHQFIIRTQYFRKSMTWIKAILRIGFVSLIFLLWISADQGSSYSWIGYLIYVILVFAFATAPIDDLGVDEKYFYYFKTSLAPFLTKETKFEISRIKSIRAGGRLTEGSDILQSLSGQEVRRNTIEITLVDDSYRSLDVAIYKKDMLNVISKVKERMTVK